VDAYLAGALIYVSSFLAFNNWDYRMVFVLLAVPQLLTWSRAAEPGLAWIARGATLSFVLAGLGSRFSPQAAFLYGTNQAAKTALCVLLLALILAEARERLRRWSPTVLRAIGRQPVGAPTGLT
jgi:hypothetical protein